MRPPFPSDTSKTPTTLPLFYARLAFVALNKLHTSTEAEIEAIVGPSLCHALQQTSGLLFCSPISSPIQEGTKESRRLTLQKSLSIMLCSHSLTRRQWRGGRRSNGTEEPVWSVLEEGELVKQSSYSPKGVVFVHKPPRGRPKQRLQRGQTVWNNSCLINQRC